MSQFSRQRCFSPQSPKGEEFQIFVIWYLSRSHQLFFAPQLCLSELFWHLDVLKIDTASTSKTELSWALWRNKKMWKEVCEMKPLLGQGTQDSGPPRRAREQGEVAACTGPSAACSVPSATRSASSCLVCSLVFVFHLAKNRETKKVSLYLFQLFYFFLACLVSSRRDPFSCHLVVPLLPLPFSMRAFPCVTLGWCEVSVKDR